MLRSWRITKVSNISLLIYSRGISPILQRLIGCQEDALKGKVLVLCLIVLYTDWI